MTAKHKHMNIHDLTTIEHSLNNGDSFKYISSLIHKDCTTISKYVRRNLMIKNSGAYGRIFNDCSLRHHCKHTAICSSCSHKPSFSCRNCIHCHLNCKDYQKEICPKLSKPPYVCNPCKQRRFCTLTKHFFSASAAYHMTAQRLSEAHSGMILSLQDIDRLNAIFVPAIQQYHQSIHHIYIHNKDSIMLSERTIYKAIDSNLLKVRNIDLPNKVKLRPRRKKSYTHKIDRSCRIDRTYENFLAFMEANPDTPLVQMDTVEGKKGGKVLLTIHFVHSSFMLAFLRDFNDARSVKNIFHSLYETLGKEVFISLFPVILTDNGSEFSDPKSLEFDYEGNQRTKIFYCDAGRPDQKGACEVNHTLIRRILPKGTSFDHLTQQDIQRVMSHINSYGRKKLNNRSPLQSFSHFYGEHIPSLLGITPIEANKVNLSPTLLKKN